MYFPKRKWTIKEECRKFYESYQWEKWALSGFYQKVTNNPDIPREELIKNRKPEPFKNKAYKYTGKHQELYEWYSKQKNPWVKFPQFVSRVRDGGYTCEQAILWGPEWEKIKEEKAKTRVIVSKAYTRTYTQKEEDKINEDYYYIKVKYPHKEACVIAREYENLLEELERKVKDIFDKESRNKIEADIVRIRTELMVFRCYNKL